MCEIQLIFSGELERFYWSRKIRRVRVLLLLVVLKRRLRDLRNLNPCASDVRSEREIECYSNLERLRLFGDLDLDLDLLVQGRGMGC